MQSRIGLCRPGAWSRALPPRKYAAIPFRVVACWRMKRYSSTEGPTSSVPDLAQMRTMRSGSFAGQGANEVAFSSVKRLVIIPIANTRTAMAVIEWSG
jgi:hypothetical protein